MNADLIRFAASFVIAYLMVRATSKMLDLRSNAVYAAIYLLNTFLNLSLINNNAFDSFRALVLNVFVGFVFPVWYSTGPLKVRLIRMSLIGICNVFCEVVFTITYLFLAGEGARVDDFSAMNPIAALAVYVVGIPIMYFVFELAILACKKHDSAYETSLDANLGSSSVLFNLEGYLFSVLTLCRMGWRMIDNRSLSMAVVFLTCIGLSFLLANLVFSVASYDAQLSRDRTNRMAGLRQTRHVKTEVTASMARSINVRRLRHDLANQIDIVTELVHEGNVTEADRYLAQLQAQAQSLTRNRP